MATMTPYKPESKFGEAKNKAQDAASNVAEKATDIAANVAESAKGMASNVADKAKDVASTIGQKADDATSALGGGMKSLAGTIREHTPQSGMLGSATSTVAQGLETSGRYLQEEGLKGIFDDVTGLVRRNPIPAMLLGVGIGFLIARATTSRS